MSCVHALARCSRVVRSGRMRQAGRVVSSLEKKGNARKILVGRSEGKGHLRDLCVDGRLILRRFLRGSEDVDWIHLPQDRGQ